MSKERDDWADIAKGISIILLVAWHTNGFHWVFGYFRMPLFFIIAGIYSSSAMNSNDSKSFYLNKVGNMIYLYVVWSFLLTFVLYIFADRGNVGFHLERLFNIFWEPLPTLWFIYALALSFVLCRLLKECNFYLVGFILSAIYFFIDLDLSGNVAFFDKFLKLFPFFWLGFKLRFNLDKVFSLNVVWTGALFVVFCILIYLGKHNISHFDTIHFFVTSMAGVLFVLLISNFLSSFSYFKSLSFVGGATIYIYLMHRPLLYYINGLFKKLDVSFYGDSVLKVFLVVFICYYLGKWLRGKALFVHLFEAPWTTKRATVLK